jgi:hypothetical protein
MKNEQGSKMKKIGKVGGWLRRGKRGERFMVEACYDNGHSEQAQGFADLEAAGRFAIDLADRLGHAPPDPAHGRAARVVIYQGRVLKLSIAIIAGGLMPHPADPQSASR